MDTTLKTLEKGVTENAIKSLDCRWLFALYAVIPASLLFIALDQFVWDQWFLSELPVDPEMWPFWAVVFGFPHIVASLLTMADREYLAHYGKILLWPIVGFAAIAIAGHLGPQPFSYQVLYVLIAFYTVYHVLAQQLGLTLMMMSVPPSRAYKAWKWSAIFAAFAIYTVVFGKNRFIEYMIGPYSLFDVMRYVAGALTAAVVVFALQLVRVSRTKIGTWYLWGNVALTVSTFLCLEAGYPLFVILIPRVIHDITAFMVYISHDSNRNRAQPRNYLYRLTGFLGFPPVVVLPVVSIGIAYTVTSNIYAMWVHVIFVTVTFVHYYFEGFIWRGANPHRASVNFKR